MTQNKHVNLLLEVLGCFVSAAGIYSFAVASGVPVTGVAGVCAILYRLFGIPMGLSNVLINIPVILFSYKVLGKSFLLRSMRCMVLFAVFTDYLLPMMPVYTGDRLLATLCGGVICGIGDALIYMQNSSTGGIDFITMAVKVKHPHLPFGNITFAAALAVIVANGLVFHDVDSIIYGLIFNFVCSAVINKMMFGFSSSMLAMIVTDDGEAACKEIDRVADRGATILQGAAAMAAHQGCSALRLFQQAAVRDRARHPEDGPGQLYHYAAIQRGPWRRFPPAGTGQERRKYVITNL
ncbi:MAG: YitT family protein [Subdoligranulum sp.]|nr:YitT family protein [Subdoligranulum sp.]